MHAFLFHKLIYSIFSQVYNILHFFAQSLQLEVLYSQALRLKRDRLGSHIMVEEYVPGGHLCLSYWRELSKKDVNYELTYKFVVQVNQQDSAKALAVLHSPFLGQMEVS